ncbi:hypothetical protein E2542_SST22371 [Spatholobus suberectus]|nr:hypothetical protein E2542_SST22371 [Spatholobus suberectus]
MNISASSFSRHRRDPKMQGSFERKEKAFENLIVSKSSNVVDLIVDVETMRALRAEPPATAHWQRLRDLKPDLEDGD